MMLSPFTVLGQFILLAIPFAISDMTHSLIFNFYETALFSPVIIFNNHGDGNAVAAIMPLTGSSQPNNV